MGSDVEPFLWFCVTATFTQKRLPLKCQLAHKTLPLVTAGTWLDGPGAPGLPSWAPLVRGLRDADLLPHASGVVGSKCLPGTTLVDSPSEVPGDRGAVTEWPVCVTWSSALGPLPCHPAQLLQPSWSSLKRRRPGRSQDSECFRKARTWLVQSWSLTLWP